MTWFARWSLRRRIVMLAAAALVGLLVVSIAVFAFALQRILTQAATDTARTQGYELVRYVTEIGYTPSEAVHELHAQGAMLQVLDERGAVLSASERRVAHTPLITDLPTLGASAASTWADLDTGDEIYRVVAQTVQDPQGRPVTMVVARPLDVESRTVTTAAALLGVGGLLLAVLLLVLVDRIVRGALRPVDRITTQVGAITRAGGGDRVSVPPTGDEIATLAATMNQMLERLDRASEATHRFVSDASHELRSPLATLRTHVETAAGPQDVDRELVHAEVLRLQGLVDDLLTLAKSDDRGLRLDSELLDLDDVVDTQVRRLRAVSRHTVAAQLEAAEIRGDEARLGQVLRNLLDNADRHAATGIRVELASTPTQAIVHVDNDGPPVPPQAREAVFDRFTRLDAARERDSGGSGLGLAIARTLTRAHGGTLTTGEAPDGWCRFTLALPLAGV